MRNFKPAHKVIGTLTACLLGLGALTACSSDDNATSSNLPKVTGEYGSAPTVEAGSGDAPTTLQVATLKEGSGEACGEDAYVNAAYLGQLWSGEQFDSSYDRGQSAIFGLDQVIEGWKEGLKDAKPGSRMELVIPPDLGYGDQAQGENIPANSTLVFVVDIFECLSTSQGESELVNAQPTGAEIPGMIVSGELGQQPSLEVSTDQLPTDQNVFVTLAEGSGTEISAESNIIIHITQLDSSSGETQTTWGVTSPQQLSVSQAALDFSGMIGIKAGSRVGAVLQIPNDLTGETEDTSTTPTPVVMDIVGVMNPQTTS